MGTRQFLEHVWPQRGPYCIAVRRTWFDQEQQKTIYGWLHEGKDDIDEAVRYALAKDSAGEEVFLAIGALNRRTTETEPGRFKTRRTRENIRAVRAYTMDIDAGLHYKTGEMRAYETPAEALGALKAFCQQLSLPKPTVVNSGSGLHVYWTLSEEVPADVWLAHGPLLSRLATAANLRHDSGRSTDVTTVLRVVGTHNHKYANAPLVELVGLGDAPMAPDAFHALLTAHGTPAPVRHFGVMAGGPQLALGNVDGNTERDDFPPYEHAQVVERCAAYAMAVNEENQRDGIVPEPVWKAAMQVAVFAKDGDQVAHEISRHDVRYSEGNTDAKIVQFRKYWPARCEQFDKGWTDAGYESPCAECPHQGKIKSPATLGRAVLPVLPNIVQAEITEDGDIVEREITAPPWPYKRVQGGIAMTMADPNTKQDVDHVFCPYDMYPARTQRDEHTNKEHYQYWMVHYPHDGWREVRLAQVGRQGLDVELRENGVYIAPQNLEQQHKFMSHYLNELQKKIPSEVEYAKLGWREGPNGENAGFLLGTTLFLPDGRTEEHCMAPRLTQVIRDSVGVRGSLDLWKQGAQIYSRPGQERWRTYMYMGLGSLVYCFTNVGSTIVNASGPGGIGKSTLMECIAAMFGDPELYVLRAATMYGAEFTVDGLHNLPLLMDEFTLKTARESSDFVFNYSGGKGKVRATPSGGVREDTCTWSNLCLTNANSDAWALMTSVHGDASPHLMRLIQIEFPPPDGTVSKREADIARQLFHDNHGHVARLVAAYIAQHKEEVKQAVMRYRAEADDITHATGPERFWTAAIACARYMAELGRTLGIFTDWPIETDVQWMYTHIATMRERTQVNMSTAEEILGDYLATQAGANTLIISQKAAGNVGNVASEPRSDLNVRKELDNGIVLIRRGALNAYCADHGINLAQHLVTLMASGTVLRDFVLKDIGYNTKYTGNRCRCIEVDLNRLSGVLTVVPAMVSAVAFAATK